MTSEATGVRVESVEIPGDGASLSGTMFRPEGHVGSAIVLHAATGVPQRFYRHFAAWLATRYDAAVLTYDYRDFGASASGHVRNSTATMTDWGVRDQSAALDFLVEHFPELPIDVVGHSLGGQMLAFHAQGERVRRMLTVGSGLPHWLKHPPSYMAQVISFWFLHGPALARTLGYLPGKMAGLGADLPAGVYWQWRRWCLRDGYYERDLGTLLPHPRPVRAQVSLIAVSDDVMVPPDRVDALRRSYPDAVTTFDLVTPKMGNLRKVGHIAPFSKRSASLWPVLTSRWDRGAQEAG